MKAEGLFVSFLRRLRRFVARSSFSLFCADHVTPRANVFKREVVEPLRGKCGGTFSFAKFPRFFLSFFFFLFRVSRRILLERRREIFLSLRFGWKDRNYVAILCEIQLLSIIESYFWIYTYVLVWFYPEEDNSIRRVVST